MLPAERRGSPSGLVGFADAAAGAESELAACADWLGLGLAFGAVHRLFRPVVARPEDERERLRAGPAGLAASALGLRPMPGDAVAVAVADCTLSWRVSNLAETGPLRVAMNDLHRLDPESGRFVAYLAPRRECESRTAPPGEAPGRAAWLPRCRAMKGSAWIGTLIGLVVAAVGCPPALAAVPPDPDNLTLRLPDVPAGYVVGDDSGCGFRVGDDARCRGCGSSTCRPASGRGFRSSGVTIDYGARRDGALVAVWTRKRFARFRRSEPGRRYFRSCVAVERVPVRRGAGRIRTDRRGNGPPRFRFAQLTLGRTVVTIGLPHFALAEPPRATGYGGRDGLATLLRGLVRRP